MKLFAWLRRWSQREQELDEEIRAHLAMAVRERIERGQDPAEAEANARREFGNVPLVKDVTRDMWGWRWLETLIQDLRFGLRQLRRNPGFTAVAVITLALGIGASTVVFNFANAIFLRPLPLVPDQAQLVAISQRGAFWASSAPANFVDWKKQAQAFSSMAAEIDDQAVTLTDGSAPERVPVAFVSKDFFKTIRVSPALGRAFLPEELEPGHGAVILSYGFWQRHFGGNQNILGKGLNFDAKPHSVIGVMPKGFDFPAGSDVWLPLAYSPAQWSDRRSWKLRVFARLKPGVSLSNAQTEMSTIARRLQQAYPETNQRVGAHVLPIKNVINGTLTPIFILTLMGAVGFVLLTACANCANLQLARATARQREIVLRSALGAQRTRLAMQLLTESGLLALIGAGGGLLLAVWGTRRVGSLMPPDMARLISGWGAIGLDGRGLAFTMAVAAAAGIISGLVPALKASNPDLNQTLKSGPSMSANRSTRRLRSVLVGAQIAIAMILVIGAGLMVKGFYNLLGLSNGFGPRTLLTMQVALPKVEFASNQRKVAFYRGALARLRAIPGVSAASLFTTPPFSNNGTEWYSFTIRGKPPRWKPAAAVVQAVSPGMLHTMHIPLQRGRDFDESDNASSAPVAVVSQKLAALYWPNQSPIGQQLRLQPLAGGSPGRWLTVVGVARDVEYDWTDNSAEPVIYRPYTQAPRANSFIALRIDGDPHNLIGPIRYELARVSKDVPVFSIQTLESFMYSQMAGLIEIGGMMTALGLIGLLIAAIGVYGVTAYSVTQRTHEIGVRMALGATRQNVVKQLLGEGMILAAVSAAVGLFGAGLITPLVSSFYYGVKPLDPSTFAAVTVILVGTTLVAVYLPARRASKVDPMVALRHE